MSKVWQTDLKLTIDVPGLPTAHDCESNHNQTNASGRY